jgi:hypothetical protein
VPGLGDDVARLLARLLVISFANSACAILTCAAMTSGSSPARKKRVAHSSRRSSLASLTPSMPVASTPLLIFSFDLLSLMP